MNNDTNDNKDTAGQDEQEALPKKQGDNDKITTENKKQPAAGKTNLFLFVFFTAVVAVLFYFNKELATFKKDVNDLELVSASTLKDLDKK